MKNEQHCVTCGQSVSIKKNPFKRSIANAAIKMYIYATRHNKTIVSISDVQQEMRLTNSEYNNMNHLVRFGLAYKSKDMKKGEYGVHMDRIQKFMQNKIAIRKYTIYDPVAKKYLPTDERIYFRDTKFYSQIEQEFYKLGGHIVYNDNATDSMQQGSFDDEADAPDHRAEYRDEAIREMKANQ